MTTNLIPNLFALSSALIVMFCLPMGLFFLFYGKNNKDRKISNVWGYFCLMVVPWGIGGYIAAIATTKKLAYLGWQIANVTSIVSPVLFLYFTCVYVGLRRHKLILIFSTFASIFLSLNFLIKEKFLGNLQLVSNQIFYISFSFDRNPVYLFFYVLFYYGVLSYSFLLLLKHFVSSVGLKRNRTKYLIIASCFGWIGAHSDFLTVFKPEIYPSLNILIAIYPIILSYAILKHKLFDMDIVFKKGLVYSTLVLIITLVYLILVILAGKAFQGLSGVESFWMNLMIMLGIAVLFNPLRQKIQRFLDKRFFSGTLESLDQERQRLQQELYQKEKLAYVGQLASSVAHEIRNPLTSIKTFLEYLPQKYQDKEFREKFNQLIPKEINRIQGVVNNLLDLSKPKTPILEKINICELLDSTLELLSDQITLKKIQVKKEYEKEDVALSIDESQMKQVFLNLFLNAIQAMNENGVLTIRTTIHPVRNNVSNGASASHCTILVSDTGHGMSEAQVKNLFTPFETTKPGGIGLGLIITQEIIHAHNGTITAESQLGQGTRFIIQLPRGKKDSRK